MMLDHVPSSALRIEEMSPSHLVGVITNPSAWFPTAKSGQLVVAANSVHAMIDLVRRRYPRPGKVEASSATDRFGFNTFRSYEEALDVFTTRPGTLVKYDMNDDELKNYESIGNDVLYDVTGDYIDVGRVLEGTPESCGNFVLGNPRNLFVNIIINLSVPHYVSDDVINYRSMRVVRLVDWLESQHIRTSVSVIGVAECSVMSTHVKDYHDHLSHDTLAVATHSEWLRRVQFRIDEHSMTWQFGYGVPVSTRYWTFINNTDDSALLLTLDWFNRRSEVDHAFDSFEKKIDEYVTEGMFIDV